MWKERLLNDCRGKHIFIGLLVDGTLDVQDKDGCNNSISLALIMTQSLNRQMKNNQNPVVKLKHADGQADTISPI
jgi:hypothetical protein